MNELDLVPDISATSRPVGINRPVGSSDRFQQSPASLPTSASGAARVAIWMILAVALMVWASPPVALMAGILFALCLGTPFPKHGSKVSKWLLQGCVVLLGFGMDLPTVLRAGVHGALFAALTIATTLLLGYWVGRKLSLHPNTSALISAGTAICGGSAIAAVASVLAVTESQIALAMATVFLLNAVALYLFPVLGHALNLSQPQFGMWAGVAIHDISSVVGASLTYGQEALQTAVAIKLSRTLWIVPLVLGIAYAARRRAPAADPAAPMTGRAKGKPRIDVPWFIGLFLLASVARSLCPAVARCSGDIALVARAGLTVVLCLIGTSLSWKALRSVGWKAPVQGVVLWIFISTISLLVILLQHRLG